ncbi:4Fe-4S dicluster domain-containing protein [Haloarcula sp. CGMCC 1.6347]|uniref:4Fe-4S dicluster domain-containing protein n=1 Tax=Haloarcula sp. CGMCC 1.6347 TaxID=3111455 RepID=UPI00300F2044
MAQTYNPQLGREHSYPYEHREEERDYHWGMVINTNRCINCNTCSFACKSTWTSGEGEEYMWWMNVETEPYGGYPMGWDMRLLDDLEADQTIFDAADNGEKVRGYIAEKQAWEYPALGDDQVHGEYPEGEVVESDLENDEYHDIWQFYLPRLCNHCKNPACLAACPRKAIYKREEDGIVLLDQERCRGYRRCVKACPYHKPMYNPETGVTEKPVGCYPRIEEGNVPRCVSSCIGKTRLHGNINRGPDAGPAGGKSSAASGRSPINYLVHSDEKVALPLYPQFGTQPQVFYMPPYHVPPEFLTQMFTPNTEVKENEWPGDTYEESVRIVQERARNPSHEVLGILQLFGATTRLIETYNVKENRVKGWDRNGEKVVDVPIEEPMEVREGEQWTNQP